MKITIMVLLCSAAIIVCGCASTTPPKAWDYKVLQGYVASDIEGQLKKAGDEGWVAVSSTSPAGSAGQVFVILKRPKR
jgi:hypothetical protein